MRGRRSRRAGAAPRIGAFFFAVTAFFVAAVFFAAGLAELFLTELFPRGAALVAERPPDVAFLAVAVFFRFAVPDLAAACFAADRLLVAPVFFPDVPPDFLLEAAFDEPLALRLAMMESFRNLDSLAISVVLSDAYRKSEGRFRAPADRNCGPPDPATRTPALVRVGCG
jgi:hypothetical protein